MQNDVKANEIEEHRENALLFYITLFQLLKDDKISNKSIWLCVGNESSYFNELTELLNEAKWTVIERGHEKHVSH